MVSLAWNQLALDGFFGHQSHRPTGLTLWRIAAYHGDDSLFLARVQEYSKGDGPYSEDAPKQFYIKMISRIFSGGQKPS
jgi:hypothetical protein